MKYNIVCDLGKSTLVKEKIEDLGITVSDFKENYDIVEIETTEDGRDVVSELPGVVSVEIVGKKFPWN